MYNEFHAGERLYMGHTIKKIAQEHIARYKFAERYIKGNMVVLDIACGSGYGSELLSRVAKQVIGVDINMNALEYAKKHHQQSNIEFKQGDLNAKLDLPDNYFDVATCFETLEHVEGQHNGLSELRRVLKPGGLLIISTPDKNIMSKGGEVENQFHVKELTKDEFVSKIDSLFKLREFFGQNRFRPSGSGRILKSMRELRRFSALRKIKRWIINILGIRDFVHKRIAGVLEIDIAPIDVRDQNKDYYVLIAVAEKK